MNTEESKKYCIEVIGMQESDFTKATQEDIELDGVNESDWIHVFVSPTECGYEGDMKTAIELASEHKFWSNPKNTDAYIDFHLNQQPNKEE